MGVPASGAPGGVPVLIDSTGGNLTLMIEVAWGAVLGSDPNTWVWSDVTPDMQVGDGKDLSITVGKADEASTSQPAQCTFTLDDRNNLYNISPLAANYPNVVRNVPIRVSLFYLGTRYVRFAGGLTTTAPGWDSTGRYAVVAYAANGVLRRLGQGRVPDHSALWNSIIGSSPVSWWSLEDDSTVTTTGLQTNSDLLSNRFVFNAAGGPGTITWAAASDLPGAVQAPTMNGNSSSNCVFISTVRTAVAAHQAALTNGWTVGWAQKNNSDATVSADVVFNCAGTLLIDVFFGPTAILITNDNSSATLFNIPNPANTFGQWHYYMFSVVKSGTSAVSQFWIDGVSQGTHTEASVTMSAINRLVFTPPFAHDYSISHPAVWSGSPTATMVSLGQVALGFSGETATARISRLAIEQGSSAELTGASARTMGPQPMDNPLGVLRASEAVDNGVLYDGLAFGLSFADHGSIENPAVPALVINAVAGDMHGDFTPTFDDLLIRNRWTVSRTGGNSLPYEQVSGPTGSAVIGVYEDSVTLNVPDDSTLVDQAAWRVNLGSISDYRYPSLPISLHAAPNLIQQWLSTRLMGWIQVNGMHTLRPQVPSDQIDMLLEGYTETIDKFTWTVSANCSPLDPWRVDVVSDEIAGSGPYLFRADADEAGDTTGAAVTSDVAVGASSISVSIRTGPLWTTTADDFPLDVLIAGIRVRVTNIVGGSSPQTFTVDPATVTKPLSHGLSITLWDPPGLGL